MSTAPGGQPQYRGPLAWAFRHSVLLGLGLALVGTVAGVLALRGGSSPAPPPPAGTSTSAAPSTPPTTSTTPSPPGGSGTSTTTAGGATTASPCVDRTSGAAASCSAAGAVVVLRTDRCTPPDVLRGWSLDPALDSLDLTITPASGACWVAPGGTASAAGITARDVLAIRDGIVAPALRQCAAEPKQTDVLAPCTSRHRVEWVGDWFPKPDTGDVDALCARRATDYTGTTLDASRLVAFRVELGPKLRCAVKADAVVLVSSVRNLDGKPLPQA